jgi:uncharacterized protein YndB with AHSA1/START domain
VETDRIEKRVFLRAPRARVWRALADSAEFGCWFGMRFDGPFAAGAHMRGVVAPTIVDPDPEVTKSRNQYEGAPIEIIVEKMEPERVFSFRWHPHAVDPEVDYSTEPTTLVEFVLEDAAGGVMLTITESGFDRIPLARRAKAFEGNEWGWRAQVKLI